MSALRELSRAHALEVLRNGKQLGLMSTWFVMVFLALAAAQFMLSGGTAPSVVQVTGPPAQVAIAEAALRDAGVSVATAAPAGETGAATLAVTLGDDGAVLRGLTTPTTAWGPTVRALSGTGIPYGHISVFDASGELIPDILRSNLGSVLIIGFLSVLLIGGTGPFVTLRARGTLRLLRTVPVRPGVVLAAFLPIRLALCAVMALIVLGTALGLGLPLGPGALRLLVTTVVALALATSLAALLAARSAKEEQMEALLPVVIMAAYGATMLAMFAPGFSPLWRAAVQALPTTWFIEAANADLIGSTPFLPVPVLWALMLALAAGLAALAIRRFRWHEPGDTPRIVR